MQAGGHTNQHPQQQPGEHPPNCPYCGKPYYLYGAGGVHHVQPKKGIPDWGIIVIVVVILVAIIIGGSFMMFIFLDPFEYEPDEPSVYDSDVMIRDGGHFHYSLSYMYYDMTQIELRVNSTNGQQFDVYILDIDEYSNAYSNDTVMSFSAFRKWENVTELNTNFSIDNIGWRDYYIVIDNRDTQLTPDDAVPDGNLNLHLYLKISGEWSY
jgi:hypothetical protein